MHFVYDNERIIYAMKIELASGWSLELISTHGTDFGINNSLTLSSALLI